MTKWLCNWKNGREYRLKGLGHILKWDEADAVSVCKNVYVEGKRDKEDRKSGGSELTESYMKMIEVCMKRM